jgi:iron complex transport system substrate-binding protein
MLRRLSIVFITLALLAACGGQPAAQSPTSAPAAVEPTVAPAATDAPAPTSAPAATGETRTITHPLGVAEVPVDPQRVVAVTGTTEVDALVELGVIPIAAAELEAGLGFSAQAAPALDGVTMLPTRREINLELVALQKPDLILGTEGWLGDIYPELSAIAPTVAIDNSTDWKGVLRQVATTVGRQNAAEARIAEVDAAIAALVERNRTATDGLTYTLMKPFPADGEYGLYRLSDIDPILQQFGMVRPQTQLDLFDDGSSYAGISTEQVELLNTDIIFLFSYGIAEDETAIQTTLSDPLFARLRAVENGNVFVVNSAHWYFSSSLAVEQVMDDLEQTILPHIVGQAAAAAPAAADPAALVVLEETSEYRLIRHSLGESKVPLQPRRIVALQDQNMLLPLLELGVGEIVGSVGSTGEGGAQIFRRTADYDTSGVTFVGEYGTPNLEAIAALKPDLILGDQFELTPENYDLFSQIAPTVVIEQFTRPVWTVMDDLALLTNRQQQAAELKARYDARVDEVRAKLGDPSAITLSVITPYNDTFYFDASEYDNGVVVIRDLGMAIPALHEEAIAQGDYPTYSMELLPQADGDALFLLDYNAEGPSVEYDVENIRRSALFGTLNAVRQKQLFVIDPSRMGGVSYGGLLGMLDAIEQHLTGRPLDTSWEPAP